MCTYIKFYVCMLSNKIQSNPPLQLYPGPVITTATRAHTGAREDREATPETVPHAHQPRVTGVCLSRVRDAAGDTLHGRYVIPFSGRRYCRFGRNLVLV